MNLDNTECEYNECNIGNFYTDAILHKVSRRKVKLNKHILLILRKILQVLSLSPYDKPNWTNISIALVPADAMYLTLPKGGT